MNKLSKKFVLSLGFTLIVNSFDNKSLIELNQLIAEAIRVYR